MMTHNPTRLCPLILLGLLLLPAPASATDKCGAVCDEAWNLAGNPYVVTCDVTVAAACTLTIEAGVEVRFQSSTALEVSGMLDIEGASGNEVSFVSNASSPAPGDWAGIQLLSGSEGALDFAEVRDAVNGVHVTGGSTTLNQVTLRDNSANGVYVRGGAVTSVTLTGVTSRQNLRGLYADDTNATINATGCTFTENSEYGVLAHGSYSWAPQLTLSGSSIHSNLGSYDLVGQSYVNAGQQTIDATGTWWGTSDEATIASRIIDHSDSSSSPPVNWCGYLDGAGGVPVHDMHCPDELGVCDGTVVWSLTDKPYLLTSDVVICPTGRLQVGAGVQARVTPQAGIGIEVSGMLDVEGASGNEVSFVSNASSPAPGDWAGIQLLSGSEGALDFAEVRDAVNGVHVTGGSTTLNQVTLRDNSANGVYVRGGAVTSVTLTGVTSRQNLRGLYADDTNATINATGCTFTENSEYGVLAHGSYSWAPQLTLSGSSIHSNLGSYDLVGQSYVNAGQQTIDATGTWWGTSDEATIASRIIDHSDSSSSPPVNWCGYLDGAGGVPVHDMHCPDELGVCDGTVVWSLTDKPYLLTSDVVICPTGRLQVGAGVQARVTPQAGIGIEVSGMLDVEGASGNEVSFVSNASSPAPGDWAGIQLLSGSEGALDFAEVRDAVNGVHVTGGSTTLNQVTLRDNSANGVYVRGGAVTSVTLTGVTSRQNLRGLYADDTNATINATGCTFTENSEYGVLAHGSYSWAPQLTLSGSSIHSNLGSYDLVGQSYQNAVSTVIWAPDNWWGTTVYDFIRDRIWDHDDDSLWSPRVWFHPFGPSCEIALGRDTDRDRHGDFDDNCPLVSNFTQADTDGDGMGDACDPDPGAQPADPCNGIDDAFDGYADADADGWGDPCDFQPTRDDSYPGAPEICDGRDNDGDALFAMDELADADRDGAITCGDCDDFEPEVYPCACESCINVREDDCDGLMDGTDPECFENPYCVVVTTGAPELRLDVEKGACGGATLSGPFDIIRGQVSQMQFAGGSVDLGNVICAAGSHSWDRVTDLSPDPNPACNDTVLFYLARDTGAGDFGAAYPGGEPRDTMNPDPVCP